MKDDEIYVTCRGITCGSRVSIDVPPGWSGVSDTELWCSKDDCKLQREWFGSVCPGCVGGYPDCGLGRSFAYSGRGTITEGHLSAISSGVCPFRVGGTFTISVRPEGIGEIEDLDLSERATAEEGEAVVRGIRAYIEKYKEEG